MRTLVLAAVFTAATVAVAAAQTAPPASPVPVATPSAAASPNATPTTLFEFARVRLDTLLRTGHADPNWFSASFLAQIPASKIDEIVAQLKGALGAYRSISGTPAAFTARFERGTDDVLIHFDADNKIDGILFKPPKTTASLDDALRALRPARGTLSYLIREGRSERAALNPSEALAVGSAFKLAVLAALQDQIRAGQRRWADVVPLDPAWKSLPSGVLQTWPDRTPIAVATYAAQMISISDNTAADALARLTGPALARHAGTNVPFLTTREMFTLKSVKHAGLRAQYVAARTPAARRQILGWVDLLPLPAATDLESTPILDVEWHYSVRELCSLMDLVADLPLMTINPGVADAAAFRRVAFKGGSDVGVMNLTTQVITKRGTTICVAATVNDPQGAIDEVQFTANYAAVLNALAGD